MIYVRDDDVLIGSSAHSDPLARFKMIHGWITETPGLLHVPAILKHHVIAEGSPGILGFPGAIEYIREETQEGRMRPEIHGLEHVNYAALDKDVIAAHLREMKDFLFETWDVEATKWYTPWGANAPHLYEAASEEFLELVDCSKINKLRGRHGIIQRLKDGHGLDWLQEDEVFMHWWEGGVHLRRLVETVKHGSWEAAVEANKGEKWFGS